MSARDEQLARMARYNAALTAWGLRDASVDDLPLMYGDSDLTMTNVGADAPRAMGGQK